MPLLTQTASQRENYSGIQFLRLKKACSYNVPTQSKSQNLLSQLLEVLDFSRKQQISLNLDCQRFLPLNRVCHLSYKFKLMKTILVLARNLNSMTTRTFQDVVIQCQFEAREYYLRVLRSNHFLYQNCLLPNVLGIVPVGSSTFAIAGASIPSNNLRTFESFYISLLARTHLTLSPYTSS